MNEPGRLATRLAAVRPPVLRIHRIEVPVAGEVLLNALPLEVFALVGLDLEPTVATDVAKVGDDTGRARRVSDGPAAPVV